DYYYYDIAYHPGEGNETNVVIVDELPDGVNFVSADPNGTYYPRPVHEYVWDLGDVDGSEPNSFYELEVRVNNYAEPEGELINIVSAESDVSYVEAEENTPVGWWGGDVIYVDEDSPGPHTGTSWETAYKYLYDNNLPNALDRVLLAPDPNAMVILVADGRYKPGTGTSDTFALHDTLEVYGGYAGYGAIDPNERDWQKYKSVLSGLISDTSRNNTVVTMGDDSLLDGFVVEEGNLRGIYGNGATSTILNCKIENNSQRGISWINGNLTIQWCEIDNNGWQGINYEGSSYSLTVENCSIHDNLRDGIKTVSSTSTIKNSMIYLNGSETIYYGVNLQNPSSNPDIHNNTIVDNINEGIRFIDNSGNDVPDISNCIVYYNGGDSQFVGLNPDTDADYCCIEDCNEIATNSNFNDEPGFVYDSEPFGYYHIKYDSPCRNAGDNSALGTGEVDMDNEPRIADDAYDIVDVGADEVDCEDTNDPNDWTYDGVINYEEFAIFANSWEKTSTDPNWQDTHSNYNFDNSGSSANVVDVADLAIFLDNWLWEACWHGNYSEVMYAMGGGGSAMMAMPASMSTATLQPAAIEEVSIADQIFELEDCIEFLEQVWLEDSYFQQEIDTDAWQEFMDAIYDSLTELEKTKIKRNKHVSQ
ncbi:MAG: right-handed parallel beta-helix repeat-containing protein, partial [Anaerohalosphaera sp.]|nr:right-handed parallel beta-helix repeat-containing protein [Anaerohalosphaera sp.]